MVRGKKDGCQLIKRLGLLSKPCQDCESSRSMEARQDGFIQLQIFIFFKLKYS